MRNLYLFQPQDANEFNGELQYWLPYSMGLLWAEARQYESVSSQWRCQQIFFLRLPIDTVIDSMQDPVLCGFSVYVWNHRYTIAVAEAIKQRWPHCVLVFGGPEVSASWLKYDFADCLVLGEGERSWRQVLDTVSSGRRLPQIVRTERMDTLDNLPSPYTTGVFDEIIRSNPDVGWNAVLETNRGCPYACTFCDWGGLTQSKIKKFGLEKVKGEIDWIGKNNVKTIFIADANFGIFRDRDLEIAHMIRDAIDRGSVLEYISMNYAKMSNEVVFDIARALGKVNKGITFSMQSMNPDTLRVIKRQNMKINAIADLIQLGDQHGLHYYTELILGLPAETKESWKNGICELLELGQHNRIEVLLAQVLENTDMFTHQLEAYRMQTIEATNTVVLGINECGIEEKSRLVKATNTMSTADMIESYMYSWMITNLHHNGYSKFLAKYMRNVHGIRYREYYDSMFDLLWSGGSSELHAEFNKVKQAIENIYTIGISNNDDIRLNNLQFGSMKKIYESVYDCQDLALAVAQSLANIPKGIIDLHHRSVENDRYQLPYIVDVDVDINTWKPGKYRFEVVSKNQSFERNYYGFYSNVRRGKHLETIVRPITAL